MKNERKLLKRAAGTIRRNWQLFAMTVPGVAWLIAFMYVPMYGVLIAFKNYMPKLGILKSPWADPPLKYFIQFFSTNIAQKVIVNTIALSGYTILFTFFPPILFALMLNQIRNRRAKKIIQTISYAPYFVSTVVVVGMLNSILAAKGFVNSFLGSLGMGPYLFMSRPEYFRPVYIISTLWSSYGFNSIIYIAALTSIDPIFYDAAQIDGATRWQCIRYIDIPQILPTIVVMLILSMGSIMTVGYEKVYLMQSGINTSVSETISTYVYKVGLQSVQFSYATSIGLFNSVVNFILILLTNGISKRVTQIGIF